MKSVLEMDKIELKEYLRDKATKKVYSKLNKIIKLRSE